MRNTVKAWAGRVAYALSPQCRFSDCIFILAHMRCGSTALSNILCSRSDVSGYGEPHIQFETPDALGRLVVNQALRGEWTPRARHLFAKNLHSRLDRNPDPGFFEARAIFIARQPIPTIRSIRKLYSTLERSEYETDREAAEYYIRRLNTLLHHWERFKADRRVGLTFDALISDPDTALDTISTRFGFDPPLENRYESRAASLQSGAGDPIASWRSDRIEPRTVDQHAQTKETIDVSTELHRAAEAIYSRYVETISSQ